MDSASGDLTSSVHFYKQSHTGGGLCVPVCVCGFLEMGEGIKTLNSVEGWDQDVAEPGCRDVEGLGKWA